MDLSVEIAGMKWQTPVSLASGNAGYGSEYMTVSGFNPRDLGAVFLKGTTLEPKVGNVMHRVWESPCGLLNSIGLQNPGARAVVDALLPLLDFGQTNYIANVSGGSLEEYAQVTAIFDDSPVQAIEVNISCPNVKKGGAAFGNDPAMSAQVVEACRKVTTKPLIIKMSPNQTDVAANAKGCIEAGADAISAINTLMGMSIDIHARRPDLGNNMGGLSGPAVKPVALLRVHQIYQVAKAHNIPVIGLGGITTAEDAIEFLLAGASAVSVGTGMARDPLIAKRINKGIEKYMRQYKIARVSDLTGGLTLNDGKLC
jgi:dihydroorotate dehydrogenase (NAD+) catalytic subunit